MSIEVQGLISILLRYRRMLTEERFREVLEKITGLSALGERALVCEILLELENKLSDGVEII